MGKLKVGIIGTGHLGKIHTKLLKEVEGCEFVGVSDQEFEKAKAEIGPAQCVCCDSARFIP